ncbi:ABC transporter ATP-binding protein [Ruicaihuangia caeni]|uniref:ABC transporter ATP-binding protein n=1 Tax=Ruicaihuangia caeni TaxID=3042517 RepID=A0AAW6T9I6_9MICO|nr:ABC transporter ATP-binding protein [Klugiella sp. YN-L-19]MDI2098725.1 ABC transporter ATP-binding protein [Klugiella sp. YN-L-19]
MATDTETGARALAVEIQGLEVSTYDGRPILHAIDLTVPRGQVLGLAGETGSGKSTLGLAMMGHYRPGLRRSSGSVVVSGHDLALLSMGALRRLRGNEIAYVPQDPVMALNPALRVREAFSEAAGAHQLATADADARLVRLLQKVGLPHDQAFLKRYPHELSGGQQQRLAIAIGFALEPSVVVMDEPTTGLDSPTKLAVMALVRELSESVGASVVVISHDLRMLMAFTDRMIVMCEGRIVDDAASSALEREATHAYTRRLLAALPDPLAHRSRRESGSGAVAANALEVRQLRASYSGIEITHSIEFDLAWGTCLALVGESGSGKTTLARCVAGFHHEFKGEVHWNGERLSARVGRRTPEQLAGVQYVSQNPFSALNPRRSVGASLAAGARLSGGLPAKAAAAEARHMLERVGLQTEHFDRMPRELSGGQRQRVALARALLARPTLLVCDEVTSSLDVSVQAEIVALLQRLQREEQLSMLFITHDLALVSSIADRVMVLKEGSCVEQGPVQQVLEHPRAEYSKRLLALNRTIADERMDRESAHAGGPAAYHTTRAVHVPADPASGLPRVSG